MRTVTKDTITDVFLGYIGQDTDPRFKQVMTSLVTHLHDFAREVDLTHDEWRQALQFFMWTGNITTEERNEFVLLSDVMGLSSLVDMINSHPGGTSSSVLGPFHISDAPALAIGGDMKGDVEGDLVLWQGVVKDATGTPIKGATVDIWQTAPNGMYSSQDPDQDKFSFHAILTTGADGRYAFTTVRPVSYTVPTDGPVGAILNAAGRHPWRPSHLHFIAKAAGYRELVTEVFPDDDPYLNEDTVFGVRDDLVVTFVPQPAGSFPSGFDLSGKVSGPYARVDFDLVLVAV